MSGPSNEMTEEKDARGQQYTKPHIGKSIAEQMWDRLDSITADMMSGDEHRQTEYNKGAGRAYAEAVMLMCRPYYDSTDAVIRQSIKRVKMKSGEVEWEPTPGYKYNPPPPGSRVEQKYLRQKLSSTPVKPASKLDSLDAATRTAIKKGLESGLFPAEDLAKAYKISVSEVNALAKQ